MKKTQSATNHTAITPLQHFVWLPLGLLMLVLSISYIVITTIKGSFTFSTLLLFGAIVLAIIPGMLARKYALTLQDRLIRTEESLRYLLLTNKQVDPRITMNQFIALRFASDEEFVRLVEKAANENLSKEEIKLAIKNWRADHHRV